MITVPTEKELRTLRRWSPCAETEFRQVRTIVQGLARRVGNGLTRKTTGQSFGSLASLC